MAYFHRQPAGRIFPSMKPTQRTTREIWHERVQAWRGSGRTAEDFANGQEFSAATLRWWSCRLGPAQAARFVELVPGRSLAVSSPGLVVEVAGAHVRVVPGFDAQLLADVVRALGGGAR
jgi:hypothetical protein